MEWTYHNDYDSFTLKIGEYLSDRGILLEEVTEAVFMVKENREDPDSSAKVTLVLGDGLTKVAGDSELNSSLKALFRPTDFGPNSMVVLEKYYIGLGIKTTSMTRFLEIKPVEDRLTILPDFIHD